MFVIRKAYQEDFEKVFPLFQFFYNDSIDKEQWSKIFKPMCNKHNFDYIGLILENTETQEIAGFVSCIFSLRYIKGKYFTICNGGSWVVKPEIQKKTISTKLLQTFFEIEGCHHQGISPVKKTITENGIKRVIVHPLYILYGGKPHTLKFKTIIPFPNFLSIFKSFKILINTPAIKAYLNDVDKKIFDDHQLPSCNHILIKNKTTSTYFILKPTNFSSKILNSSNLWVFITKAYYKIFKKNIINSKIRLGMIHYVNNPAFFSKTLNIWTYKICKHLKVRGLSINEKFTTKKSMFILNNDINTFGVYKSKELNSDDFDTLYSELIVFDMDL